MTAGRPSAPVRTQVTWLRTGKFGKPRITHPYFWIITEPDGYERCFDTKREAQAWIAENYPEEGE